jgi:hypothetical protein
MAAILEVYESLFAVNNDTLFCSHARCGRVASTPDNDLMEPMARHLQHSFRWMFNADRNRWIPTTEYSSRSCKQHRIEWIEHCIAVEVFCLGELGLQINRSILEICPTSTIMGIISNMIERNAPRKRRQEPVRAKITEYNKLPLKCIRDPEMCVICYTEKKLVSLNCNHVTCYECLKKIKSSCPYCRTTWNIDKCFRLRERFEIVEC